jgi:hypothetical protein
MIDLKERARARLEALELEAEKGRKQLALLEQRRTETLSTLARVSGAIQVLRELLANESPNAELASTAAAAE